MILEWTPRARRELAAQLQFIALDKPSAAERMSILVGESTTLLETLPRLGKPSRIPGCLDLVIAGTPFIAIYRIKASRVSIVRLMHKAQSRR